MYFLLIIKNVTMKRLLTICFSIFTIITFGQIETIIDAAKDVDETGGGYRFSVVVLAVVIVTLIGAVTALWIEMKTWKKDYVALSSATAKMLAEFNMKLDGQTDIKKTVDEVKDVLLQSKHCKYGSTN